MIKYNVGKHTFIATDIIKNFNNIAIKLITVVSLRTVLQDTTHNSLRFPNCWNVPGSILVILLFCRYLHAQVDEI